jgi:hypothetical protein
MLMLMRTHTSIRMFMRCAATQAMNGEWWRLMTAGHEIER